MAAAMAVAMAAAARVMAAAAKTAKAAWARVEASAAAAARAAAAVAKEAGAAVGRARGEARGLLPFYANLVPCTFLPSYAKMPSLLPYPHPMLFVPARLLKRGSSCPLVQWVGRSSVFPCTSIAHVGPTSILLLPYCCPSFRSALSFSSCQRATNSFCTVDCSPASRYCPSCVNRTLPSAATSIRLW